jgi:UDP-N-acetylglucosamine 2-epimerase
MLITLLFYNSQLFWKKNIKKIKKICKKFKKIYKKCNKIKIVYQSNKKLILNNFLLQILLIQTFLL